MLRRRLVAESRMRASVVMELNVSADESALLFKTSSVMHQQRVVKTLHLERAIEALHRGIVVAVGCPRESLLQAHAAWRLSEVLCRADASSIAEQHCPGRQTSKRQKLKRRKP